VTVTDPAEPPAKLLRRVAATRAARDLASAVHDQAIRDAKAAGHPVTGIASTLGVTNRVRLYDVLEKSFDYPADPGATPVVFLRGAGAPPETWRDVETAMHRRGLATVRDRQQAWHLARGGVPVVLVDFSTGAAVSVGRVKAKWSLSQATRSAGQLLSPAERERLAAAGAQWLDTQVTVEEREAVLPLADPDDEVHLRNEPINPDELARAAVGQLTPA